MNNILSEKEYQKYILERLSENGYEIKPSASYDRFFAIDKEALFRFLNTTQPDEMRSEKYTRQIWKTRLLVLSMRKKRRQEEADWMY